MRQYRVLTGPTAAGKTAWLAARGSGRSLQVISADSRQVYRYMDIGTGKPAPSIADTVTHHCLSLVTPGTEFSVFHWLPLAVAAMESAWESGAEVWVSGGTGLYIRALLDQLSLGAPPKQWLRRAMLHQMEVEGPRAVAAELGLTLVDNANPMRVLRAAELACEEPRQARVIYRAVGVEEPSSAASGAESAGYAEALGRLASWRCAGVWVLDPGRERLAARIESRVAGMFADGLVDEVSTLRRLGYGEASCVAEGIAYREAGALLDGTMGQGEAIAAAVTRTRQYAKRQRTYFRGRGWPPLPPAQVTDPGADLPCSQVQPDARKFEAEIAGSP